MPDAAVPSLAPVSVAPASATPIAPASTTPIAPPDPHRCSGYAATPPTPAHDRVFHGEHLVKQAVETQDVSYVTWHLDPQLDDAGRTAACREKARKFCTQNNAPDALCRFDVRRGETPIGWNAARPLVDPPSNPHAKKPRKPTAAPVKDHRKP